MPDFTKGKWVDSTCGTIRIEDDNGESKCSICECFVDEPYIDEHQAQANARLIAAAPDMYNFLLIAAEDRFVDRFAMMHMACKLLDRIDGKEAGHE